ncbi:MAG: VacJ family lipoprotein, partial [Sphingomonadales bacterium]|nr:VacJ family lipoprotein [Sphingomonadales bacterium]
PINRVFYAINRPIDRFVFRPAAMAYKAVLPKPVRDGARNFLQLIDEPAVIFNDVLQLRPGRAIKGVARFVLNATLGFGGLFDVARRKPFKLPHHDNSFGDTLGYYGMGPLLYVYLPVLGPITVRDFGGGYVDDLVKPRLLYAITHPDSDKPIFRTKVKVGRAGTAAMVVGGLDERAESDEDLKAIEHDSVDPYAAMRTSFLQDRAGEIASLKARDGAEPVNPHLDDPLADPAATPDPAPAAGK